MECDLGSLSCVRGPGGPSSRWLSTPQPLLAPGLLHKHSSLGAQGLRSPASLKRQRRSQGPHPQLASLCPSVLPRGPTALPGRAATSGSRPWRIRDRQDGASHPGGAQGRPASANTPFLDDCFSPWPRSSAPRATRDHCLCARAAEVAGGCDRARGWESSRAALFSDSPFCFPAVVTWSEERERGGGRKPGPSHRRSLLPAGWKFPPFVEAKHSPAPRPSGLKASDSEFFTGLRQDKFRLVFITKMRIALWYLSKS